MKIRKGFVSNSSSSSFLIVGIDIDVNDHNDIKLLEAIGYLPEHKEYGSIYGPSFGQEILKGLTVVGSGEPIGIGLNAESLLKKNKTVADIAQLLLEKLATFDYKPRTEPTLQFGTAGNE